MRKSIDCILLIFFFVMGFFIGRSTVPEPEVETYTVRESFVSELIDIFTPDSPEPMFEEPVQEYQNYMSSERETIKSWADLTDAQVAIIEDCPDCSHDGFHMLCEKHICFLYK